MTMSTLGDAALATGGVLQGADGPFSAVSTDTRSLSHGELFFALKGERFDALEFVRSAAELEAAGAVVEQHVDVDLAQVVVSDTRRALGDFARSWRQRFDIPVIGITGSNGKTTVKELTAAILRVVWNDDEVLATEGNLIEPPTAPRCL